MKTTETSTLDSPQAPAGIVLADHIVEVKLQGIEYTRSEVEAVISGIQSALPNERIYLLVEAHPSSTVTFDGVRALFTESALSYAHAKAYVLKNNFHFKIGEMCMVLFSPKTPLKFFRNSAEAREWLKEQRVSG